MHTKSLIYKALYEERYFIQGSMEVNPETLQLCSPTTLVAHDCNPAIGGQE